MEEKKSKKSIILIIILIVLVLSEGAYIIVDKFFITSNAVSVNNKSDKLDDNTLVYVSKINESKDWVYDLTIPNNGLASSYTTNFGETYNFDDIKVAFINIDSEDAEKANTELGKLEMEVLTKYQLGVEDKITYVDNCKYETFYNDVVLSILQQFTVGGTDVPRVYYLMKNFDLKTGKNLTYKEAYTAVGISDDQINEKVENEITSALRNKLVGVNNDNYEEGTSAETLIADSIKDYENSVNDNTVKYYIGQDGKLGVYVQLHVPAGDGIDEAIVYVK